ncbi:MAG TPA: TdeIII family type II restriction endonuclease, partial [Bacteroidales bacterium]|nr:TdeIII family type II restriction endonuclease [Bacteroidales bacterium]
MSLDDLKKELIALEVIRTLKSRFDNFPEDASDNRNAPFHEAFLEAFKVRIEEHVTDIPIFVSLASWMHGLNTSLGQSFFEKASHILSDGEKREFTNLLISKKQQAKISDIISALKNRTRMPSLRKENKEIFISDKTKKVSTTNFSADVFFEEDDKLILIELKTVKPNSDIFKEQKNKFLNAKAALFKKFPQKEFKFYLGFPFDPLNDTNIGYDKDRFFNYSIDFKKYFDKQEVLLADELWDFLSQEKETMLRILEIINSIAKPDFMEKFNFINDTKNFEISSEKFKAILSQWSLHRDLKIFNNYSKLKKAAET